MKLSILAFTLLSVAVVSAYYVPLIRRQTVFGPLSGTWFNELGSVMNLTATTDGSISGLYCSAVGNATNFYTLTGRFDPSTTIPTGEGVSLGWVVNYANADENADSTAAWSGQFFAANATILTQWLLTSSTTPADEWESTNVGHDQFTRTVQVPSACSVGISGE